MLFHSAQDPELGELVFRCVQNAAPLSAASTLSIAVGAAVILATATDSTPNTDPARGQNFVTAAGAAGAQVNNLLVGILAQVPGTKGYLDRNEVGLACIYGAIAAQVPAGTAAFTPGQGFVPGSAGLVASAAGALIYAIEAVGTGTGVVMAQCFVRCM